ncbi:hypothetical protein PHMEG_00021700 [Phytophthora megakarya]|uniref:Reverse transcriptase/retrotransposon-derived protein RNase H-like domain-containing protein n=1 Tax=Phytophthora megakarya TaxID=4795 RepID=A0A225VKL6_9STRA|nr:hypothetical protein PHMEG_00021700 [Phytophthora megakarya]
MWLAEEDVERIKTGVAEGSTRPRSKYEADREISVSFTKSIFVQSRVDFLSHEVVPEGLRADAMKIKRVTEFTFPTSKKCMQSFLGALDYYNRFIQDFAVYAAPLYQPKEEDFEPGSDLSVARQSFARLLQNIDDAPSLRHFDRQKDIHVTLFANEWALRSTLIQEHERKMHPVRFCGRVLKEAEMNYHPAEKEVLALLQLLKTCYTLLSGAPFMYIRVGTHVQVSVRTNDPIRCDAVSVASGSHQGQRKGLLFRPALHKLGKRVLWIGRLVGDGFTAHEEIFHRPHGPYARLPQSYCGIVVSFDGLTKTEKYGGYGSCSWIVLRLPDWTIVTAASAYLEATTVNMG